MDVPPLITSTAVILDKFDTSDPANIGRPFYFDLAQFITTIECFICSDEIQTALWLLDNPPAWYRMPENYPKELTEIRNRIYRQTYDQIEYSTDDDETEFSTRAEDAANQWMSPYCYPRNEIISGALAKANEEGKTPWLHDVGCSHGNMPLGLKKAGLRFTYRGSAVNYRARENLRGHLGNETWADSPLVIHQKWLVCTEVIEHCFNPHDVVHSALKICSDYDQIFLSVPLGCLYHGLPNWKDRRVGHVRGWAPEEFMTFANKSFPGYTWLLYKAPSMVLHGKR
jgi:hypothetical protein